METKTKQADCFFVFFINCSIDIENVIFVLYLTAEKRNALAKTNQEIEYAAKELEAAKEVT